MSAFTTTTIEPQRLDPHKRVCYSTGLVLGVDEFLQEQTYFAARDENHNRLMHGYGTVWGLHVHVRSTAGGPEIVVEPGAAVDPQGRLICVDQAQCSRINAWLETNSSTVLEQIDSLPGPVSLYVVLCHRECKTDLVPVPGGPCRSADEAQTPSRLADDFELQLVIEPPSQIEHEALMALGDLMRLLRIDATGPFVTPSEVADLVRGLVTEEGSAPDLVVNPIVSSPPQEFLVSEEEVEEVVRTAMRTWVTEVRPLLIGDERCRGYNDRCVLLGRVDMAIVEVDTGVALEPETEPVADVEGRPVLVSTALLQEWLIELGLRRE